jgi:hypothetical protein
MTERTLTFRERFKERFPLYHVQPPEMKKVLKFIEEERQSAGAEGIILGSQYERATLFEIISKTDAEGTPAEFKQQILDYLAQGEDVVITENPNENPTP